MMACILANKLSSRLGVPVLLLFILLGIVFGSDGLFKIQFDNYEITESLSSVALIFIMFYGGFGTCWRVAKPVALPAVLLSTFGVVITAALTGLFCHFVLKMTILEGLLIGAIIGSTDAASVFSVLRTQNLNLKHGLASLLEIESGSNDPTAYMLTIVILSLMRSGENVAFGKILASQIGFGLLFGFLTAFAAVFVLKRVHFENGGLESILVVAIAFISYALPATISGNGYLAVYITGIVLGNSKIHHKTQLVHFFDGITWIMQIMLFFVIGLLAYPSQIPSILLPAVLIALFLTFVSRPIAVFALLTPFRFPFKQQLLVAWSGLRGAASIVFAIMAVVDTAYTGGSDIFHIVFCVALLSVGFCGTLLPFIAKKLDLVDDSDPVFKTFTDYDHLSQMPLLDITVTEGHPWAGKTVSEMQLPADLLIIMIKRRQRAILPRGKTKIIPGDVLIVSGTVYQEEAENVLNEELIYEGHDWQNKRIKDVEGDKNILLLRRNHTTMIPTRDTVLLKNDTVVFSEK